MPSRIATRRTTGAATSVTISATTSSTPTPRTACPGAPRSGPAARSRTARRAASAAALSAPATTFTASTPAPASSSRRRVDHQLPDAPAAPPLVDRDREDLACGRSLAAPGRRRVPERLEHPPPRPDREREPRHARAEPVAERERRGTARRRPWPRRRSRRPGRRSAPRWPRTRTSRRRATIRRYRRLRNRGPSAGEEAVADPARVQLGQAIGRRPRRRGARSRGHRRPAAEEPLVHAEGDVDDPLVVELAAALARPARPIAARVASSPASAATASASAAASRDRDQRCR